MPDARQQTRSPGAPVSARRVRVLLPLPLPEPYDYLVPDGMDIEIGDYVEVPLAQRRSIGVVWGEATERVPSARLKPIIRRFDAPPMPDVSRRLIEWVASYTLSPLGAVLRMAVSVPLALEPPKPMLAYRRSTNSLPDGFKVTAARQRVLYLMGQGGTVKSAADISIEAECGAAMVRGLADAGVLEPVLLAPDDPLPQPDPARPGPEFSSEQADAVEVLCSKVREHAYAVTVLDGVTGSGKTEVYLEAIATCLANGRQALVLLPEIALSPQFLDRFAHRFGNQPVSWHSELTGAQRRRTWRAVATGEARVVVGARSALFLPFPDLGLIVVDEEHDGAFKQEDGVMYHARDMAVVRGHLGNIPVVLSSATPSLETLANVEAGKYARVALPARHGNASMPEVSLLDLRVDKPEPRRWLAPSLCNAITETLSAGEQAMLFLNRRGYAPLTLCRTCGHRLQCPNCTAWLVEHRLTGRLHCHHCGHGEPLPSRCPACEAEGSLAACGPGVERIAEEVAWRFPDARTLLMASDTLTTPRAIREAVERIRDGEVDLIIGTQIVAKGHHFPKLTLVGVVDADLGLAGGDLRAAERTYQLLQQVSGRAGRAEHPGRVILQTFQPEHPVMQALVEGDRDAFLAREAAERRDHGMPPFGRLVALIVSGPDPAAVDSVARALGRSAPRFGDLVVLGPAPAPLAQIRGRHRRRLLLKAPRGVSVQSIIFDWLQQVPVPSSVRVQIDVDPYSFL